MAFDIPKSEEHWFAEEAGGHRYQRVPPTEAHGRRHTSTVTVAVVDGRGHSDVELGEVIEKTCRGSGKGGQNRNKRDTAVQLTHAATGIMVRSESERSQAQNRRVAYATLKSRLAERARTQVKGAENASRRAQVGCGARGDKVRTVSIINDRVTNHKNGKKCSATRYLEGGLDLVL